MRRFISLLVLFYGAALFTACSKKADTAPGASNTPAPAAPEAAASTTPPAEDPGVAFHLSGSTDRPAASTTPLPTAGLPSGPTAADGNFSPAQRINEIFPFYPLSLRMQGIEGRVDVRIVINTEGRVESAEVVRSTEARLSPYALEAVRTARFLPAQEKGQPVSSTAEVGVPFVSVESELSRGSLGPDSILARLTYLDGLYYVRDGTGKLIPADGDPIRLRIITPYPATAKPGETVKARVKVSITEEGQVTSVSVSESTNPEFATALKDIALFWQFIPKLKNGKPVALKAVEFPLLFDMPPAKGPN